MRGLPRNPHVIRDGHRLMVEVEGRLRHYGALHQTLRKRFRKPKRCWSCGEEKRLDWALRPDAEGYSLNIEDYFPLCRGCHARMDLGQELTVWLEPTEDDK
jgi:hypothetical protein